MTATHAISKSELSFQNRSPREFEKNLYIPIWAKNHKSEDQNPLRMVPLNSSLIGFKLLNST